MEVIEGDFLSAYNQAIPGSIRTAAQIMEERITNMPLMHQWLYTGDGIMYQVEEGDSILYLSPPNHNLFLKNVDKAVAQTNKKRYYNPNKKGIDEVIESYNQGETLRIPLSKVRATEKSDSIRFRLDIPTASKEQNPECNYEDNLNPIERLFAEWIFRKGEGFKQSMKMLSTGGGKYIEKRTNSIELRCWNIIETTSIFYLSPTKVEEYAKDKAICLVPWFNDSSDNMSFGAGATNITYNCGALYAQRKNPRGIFTKPVLVYERDNLKLIEDAFNRCTQNFSYEGFNADPLQKSEEENFTNRVQKSGLKLVISR
jgi:hypothetical protein